MNTQTIEIRSSSGRHAEPERTAVLTPGERRSAPRVPQIVELDVHIGSCWHLNLRTRDLSCDGAFVESASCPFALNDRIELRARVSAGGRLQQHRFSARVARVTTGGAGIVFGDADLAAYAALLHLLVAPPRVARKSAQK